MTDEKKAPEGAEQFDWDQALSEWDKGSFVPEVAKDVSSDKPAVLSGGSVSKPLYRPPPAPPPPRPKAPPMAGSAIPRPLPAAGKPPPPPAAKPPTPPPAAPTVQSLLDDDDDDDGGGTLVTIVPRELLLADDTGPKSSSRGGLGQLFARDDKRDASSDDKRDASSDGKQDASSDDKQDASSVDVSFDDSQPRLPIAESYALIDPPSGLMTSARPVMPSRPELPDSDDGRLRLPSLEPVAERVLEGGLFDPFAAPEPRHEPRSRQLTRPADDEVQNLLAATTAMPPSGEAPAPTTEKPAEAASLAPTSRGTTLAPPGSTAQRSILSLLPEEREYDPNEETMVGDPGQVARIRASLRAPAPKASSAPPPAPPPPAPETPAAPEAGPRVAIEAPARVWPEEKPASAWLSEEARQTLVARAEWLEQEARAQPDKASRARTLLACSEILATAGEREQAQALAVEARELGPSVALAHRQARALMPAPADPEELIVALDAEVKMTPAGDARVHSMLLAYEAVRAAGDDEGASKRLEQVVRSAATDVRAPIARATRALARGDTANAALRLPESPELAPVAEAINLALRLRGVERKEIAAAESSPNELLYRARQALDNGDVAAAAPLVAKLAALPELSAAATWLAAALGATRPARRADAVGWLRQLVESGDDEARRALAARGIELGDPELVAGALAEGGPFASVERVAISSLLGLPLAPNDPHLDAAASSAGMTPLVAAVAALSKPAEGDAKAAQALARARRTAGSAESRALVQLGRLLAFSAPPVDVEAALEGLGDAKSAVRAVALEMAARAGRTLDVSGSLEAWGASRTHEEDRAGGALAAALVAERFGHAGRALEAYKAARAADPTHEAALRAIASLEQVDLVAEMNTLADELTDGPRSAVARLEAVTRGEGVLPEPTRADLLEKAYRAAPGLPMAAFLAERIARRSGDVDEVLRWVRERRAATTDPIEGAIESIREARLVADREPTLASERLLDAHRARPNDVGLRELTERMAHEPLEDRAAWRELRASEASGDARTLLFLEAAQEYERSGDEEGALRSAEAAAATESALGLVARERAELRGGHVSRLAEELLASAKSAEDLRARREAYERLAVLDASARQDPASALLWHRSILEEAPGYAPSLRYVEQHFISEGRDDELEPIASAIAGALRGTGPGEGTAHAELAARLRMRGTEGSWEATREMVELAASEGEPSLWSLRMLLAHARARGDDEVFLATTLKLLDRSPRPAEAAVLLVRAGETASRIGRLEQARSLLERAATEDPGDIITWGLLADVRQRAGDTRGAAEACEALARSSAVSDHQLLAWYDAGRLWSDEVHDDDRALVALEAAASLDVAYSDVFDRLSRLYAQRKMQPELASLLERRVEGITDPAERLAMEVRRGRILLEVGDVEGARAVFEFVLSEQPDDVGALSAFADLCVAQRDWEGAEQALVRLARLLPTQEEQRDVYGRLGDLYSQHLLNLSRAEVSFKEVLRRAPEDVVTTEKLVDVYKRQNDPARAVELQQELVAKSTLPEDKRRRVIELAAIYEHTAHDNRRAEQALEAARREFPQDVAVLRALAEFYIRQHQTPAVNILLDRAGADARRGLTAGRFAVAPFGILATVFELRGKKDAARVTRAMLAAYEGQPAELDGAAERAFDPRLDDVLAPDVLTPAMRSLLRKTGEALEVAAAVDLRALKATPLSADAPVFRLASSVSHTLGLGPVQVFTSPKVGPTCLPVGSSPPTVVLGESIANNERLASFLLLRALKLVSVKASAFGRTPPAELAVLVSAWLKCFNPSWQPQGINAAALNAAGGRVQAALPRNMDPDVGVIALEVAGGLGTQAATLGPSAVAWGNRVAFLALGDPNAALDAIAGAGGQTAGAPRDPAERATWIGRTAETRDLVSFAVTDAFAEARARLGLDH